MRAPGQPSPTFRLLGISINRCCGDVSFEPLQLGYEILDLLLDVLGMLQTVVSVAGDDHSPNKYLVMLDERAHAAEGGLERGEPIGGFFRNV